MIASYVLNQLNNICLQNESILTNCKNSKIRFKLQLLLGRCVGVDCVGADVRPTN